MWVLWEIGRTTARETAVSRISIDVTDAEHRKLKALAALNGQSVKRFVLARTIGDQAQDADLSELEQLLDRRIDRAQKQGASRRTVGGIFGQARRSASPCPDA